MRDAPLEVDRCRPSHPSPLPEEREPWFRCGLRFWSRWIRWRSCLFVSHAGEVIQACQLGNLFGKRPLAIVELAEVACLLKQVIDMAESKRSINSLVVILDQIIDHFRPSFYVVLLTKVGEQATVL